jgi:uncharacterized damage-inducible protein DinB
MPDSSFIAPDALLAHWQGHRRLTRRVIEAFPEDKLNAFCVGGMRTFGELAGELLDIAVPMVRGLLTDEWNAPPSNHQSREKAEILRLWDETTAQLDELWPQFPPALFHEQRTAFGKYPGAVHDLILYAIDNEIHHRGQGYVYLRALGIEPPAFYDRS